jgi:hypothetical protein
MQVGMASVGVVIRPPRKGADIVAEGTCLV